MGEEEFWLTLYLSVLVVGYLACGLYFTYDKYIVKRRATV